MQLLYVLSLVRNVLCTVADACHLSSRGQVAANLSRFRRPLLVLLCAQATNCASAAASWCPLAPGILWMLPRLVGATTAAAASCRLLAHLHSAVDAAGCTLQLAAAAGTCCIGRPLLSAVPAVPAVPAAVMIPVALFRSVTNMAPNCLPNHPLLHSQRCCA